MEAKEATTAVPATVAAAVEAPAATAMASTHGRDQPPRAATAATTTHPVAAETSTGGEIKKEFSRSRNVVPTSNQRFTQFMRSVC